MKIFIKILIEIIWPNHWSCRDCRDPVTRNVLMDDMDDIKVIDLALKSAVLAAPTALLITWQNKSAMLCLPYALMPIDITMTGHSEVCFTRGSPSEVQDKRLREFRNY